MISRGVKSLYDETNPEGKCRWALVPMNLFQKPIPTIFNFYILSTFIDSSLLNRGVAQLGARSIWDAEVGGSSPLTPTFSS